MGKTTIRGKTYNDLTEEQKLSIFLRDACGVEAECRNKALESPKVLEVLLHFKEPAYRVQTLESLLMLEAKDIDELLAPLPMATRASIKRGCAEGI